MLPEVSFWDLVVAFIISTLMYVVFKLFVSPCIGLLYYKRQGLPVIFHRRLVPMLQWWEDVYKKGNFLHVYKQILKDRPDTKAVAQNFLTNTYVTIIHPEMIKEFLRKWDVYHKCHTFTGPLDELLAGNITQAEGAEWKKRRKTLSAAFNFELLRDTIPMIVETTQEKFSEWIKYGDLRDQDLVEKLTLITGEVAGRFMFGKRFGRQKLNGVPITIAIQRLFADASKAGFSASGLLFGTKFIHAGILQKHKKLNSDTAAMRALCKKMIDEQTTDTDLKERNFLKLLLDARLNAEDHLTDGDITGEFLGFFLAGTDTTSHLVASTLYFLSKHPEVFARVKEEADREFMDVSKIDIDNLNRMDYTTAVLKESLRLGGPIAALFDRVAVQDDTLCGVKIKKGTLVNMLVDVLFTSEEYYSRPKEFIPERWLDDPQFAHDLSKKEMYAFTPFSGGPRNCIGQHLAMIEARIVLALFIRTFDFSFADGYKFLLVVRFLYEALDPLMITLKLKV